MKVCGIRLTAFLILNTQLLPWPIYEMIVVGIIRQSGLWVMSKAKLIPHCSGFRYTLIRLPPCLFLKTFWDRIYIFVASSEILSIHTTNTESKLLDKVEGGEGIRLTPVFWDSVEHINIRIPQTMFSSIPHILGLGTRTSDPYVYVVFWGPFLV